VPGQRNTRRAAHVKHAALKGLGTVLIYFVIMVLPFLLLPALIVWGIYRLATRKARGREVVESGTE